MPKELHHEDIVQYAAKLSEKIESTDGLSEGPDLVDWLNDQLSLEIWTKKAQRQDGFDTMESFKAEILITYGGPTVMIELDSRWNHAVLYHSWGWHFDPLTGGEALPRVKLSAKVTSLLVNLIEELAAE